MGGHHYGRGPSYTGLEGGSGECLLVGFCLRGGQRGGLDGHPSSGVSLRSRTRPGIWMRRNSWAWPTWQREEVDRKCMDLVKELTLPQIRGSELCMAIVSPMMRGPLPEGM
jgi:hypothetical protein